MSLTRRDFMKWMAASTGVAAAAGCADMGAGSAGRVVVIGGGYGGATCARYIRIWAPDIDVTMVERNSTFVSCPISNLVLGGNTTIVYAASKNPNFVADLELKDTRAHWAAPFRKDSVALRNQMQDVINCMKKDGTIAKLSERWFGKAPPPDGLERVITPGYGVPGMPGYDPTPHNLKC